MRDCILHSSPLLKAEIYENTGIALIRDKNGQAYIDDKAKAALLNKQVVSVFPDDDDK